MILEWFFDLVEDIWTQTWDAIWAGLPPVPDWLVSMGAATASMLSGVGPLCPFVDFGLAAIVLGSVVAMWVFSMGAAGFKMFLSVVTGGGGSK